MILTTLLAAGLLLLLLDFSFNLARKFLPQASISLRWCAAGVVAIWTLIALFHLLAGFGQFRPWPALISLAAVSILARLTLGARGTWTAITNDFNRAVVFMRASYSEPGSWLLYAVTLLLVSGFVRALLLPPLAWDSLTYHLVLAARWIQSGRHLVMPAPDAWTYYQYFPANGEIISAWLMLPFHDDRLVSLSCFPPFLLLFLASYVLARHLEASASISLRSSLVVVTLPVILTYLTTAYIDTLLIACLLVTTVFLLVFVRNRVPAAACLSLMAAGIGLGAKLTCLASIAACGLVLIVAAMLLPSFKRNSLAIGVGILCFVLVAMPWYLLAWRDHGSPFYPLPIRVLGHTLSEGSASLIRTTLPKKPQHWSLPARVVAELKIFGPKNLGLGPLSFFCLIVSPWCAKDLWRRGRRLEVIILASLIIPAIAAYYSPQMMMLRMNWPTVSARLVGFPYVLLTICSVCWILSMPQSKWQRRLRGVLEFLVVLNVLLAWWWMIGYTPVALAWILILTLFVLLMIYAWARIARTPESTTTPITPPGEWRSITGLALICVIAVSTILPLRRHYQDKFRASCEEAHELPKWAEPAWRWARHVNGPRRIAFSAGYEYPGHNWFWYPLFGDKLQHEVIYVPITSDGHIVDYMDTEQVSTSADRLAWLRRIDALKIDTAIWFQPPPIEASWMNELPNAFLAVPNTGETGIYTVDRATLRAMLATQPAS